MKKILLSLLLLIFSCDGRVNNETLTSFTPTLILPPSKTAPPPITVLPSQTSIATSVWIPQGPNEIVVPILLYHHITESAIHS